LSCAFMLTKEKKATMNKDDLKNLVCIFIFLRD